MKDYAPRSYKGPTKSARKGLLIVLTGEGKGKTSSAFGMVFRALGRGMKVAIVQFIKGKWVSGEIKALKRFGRQADYFSFGEGFTWETKNLAKDKMLARKAWELCEKLLLQKKHQVFLFDEILYALKYRFLSVGEVGKGLDKRDPSAHVILTGRGLPKALSRRADLITEMKSRRHPFHKGILAQAGIDY